jgi:hypothetical protein
MLKAVLAAGVLVAAYAGGPSPAHAQFNAEWCTQGRMLDCAYHTREQCLAAASGNGWSCVRNPNYQRPERHRR